MTQAQGTDQAKLMLSANDRDSIVESLFDKHMELKEKTDTTSPGNAGKS